MRRRSHAQDKEGEFEASLVKPFYDRPGHWGVFLIARFDVGPALLRAGDRHRMHHPAMQRFIKAELDETVGGGAAAPVKHLHAGARRARGQQPQQRAEPRHKLGSWADR